MNGIEFSPGSSQNVNTWRDREESVRHRLIKQGYRIVQVIYLNKDKVMIVATRRFSV